MKRNPQEHNQGIFVNAARRAVREVGWSPRYDLEFLRPDGSPSSSQIRYGYRTDKVRLRESPNLLNHVTAALDLVGEANLGAPDDALYDVVASRVYLQVGSFKVCPYSVYDYHEILDACADGLRSAGAAEPAVINFTVPVTSFFIGSVVSGVYGLEGPDPTSFRRGWPLDHIISSATREASLQTYVALYASVQLRLWSDNEKLSEALRGCFPQPLDSLEFDTDRGVAILLDTYEFVGTREDGLAWSDDDNLGELIVSELKYNWRSWPIKAFQWAEMIAPYVNAEREGRQIPPRPQVPPSGQGLRPSEEARDRRNLIRTGNTQAGQNLPWLDDRGNRQQVAGVPAEPYGDLLLNDQWFRQRLLQIGIGGGRRPQVMDYDTLDALYRSRVAKVEIESEVTCRKGMAFEITHVAREELDSFPGFNNIDWGATRVTTDKKLQLYEKKIPITDQTPTKREIAGFPDLLFIVDSSGSMKWDPRGGTGPYDSLLRAIYSVFNFLEKHNKAQYMRFAVVNFSSTTVKTPWLAFAELRRVKESLFKYQGGGTKLDCDTIRQIVNASGDRFLCLMVTDAQISNVTDVFNTVKMMADRGHGFVLVQIGQRSPLFEQARKAGLAAHVINDPGKLEGLCLDYARKTWSRRESKYG